VAHRLPKRLFWHYCHCLVGSALVLIYSPKPLDGAIFVTSFACGPDSLIGEVLKWHARQMEIPFLLLTLDEHTAEAGMVTRLEAFVDMIGRREGR
jgi:predicted nucleotide-binding protein (sugar kinase/HSP70/actin superfamily)